MSIPGDADSLLGSRLLCHSVTLAVSLWSKRNQSGSPDEGKGPPSDVMLPGGVGPRAGPPWRPRTYQLERNAHRFQYTVMWPNTSTVPYTGRHMSATIYFRTYSECWGKIVITPQSPEWNLLYMDSLNNNSKRLEQKDGWNYVILYVQSWKPSQVKYKMEHEIVSGISGLLHIWPWDCFLFCLMEL